MKIEAMLIDLNKFELHVEKGIYHRGLSYYEEGHVGQVIHLKEGLYEFKIAGTYYYTIRLKLKENKLADFSCDCPHEAYICKHIVAAVLQLKNMNLKNNPPQPVSEKMDEIFQNIDHSKLEDFIKKEAIANSDFRNNFLKQFSYLTAEGYSADFYKEEVNIALDSYIYRFDENDYYQGYHYDDQAYLEDKLIDVFGVSPKEVNSKNFQQVLEITKTIFNELIHRFKTENVLDEDDLFLCLCLCFEYFSAAGNKASDDLRNQIFQLLWKNLEDLQDEILDGLAIEWAKGAYDLAAQKQQKEMVFKYLKEGDFELEEAELLQKFIYQMSLELEGAEKAEGYLKQFIASNPELYLENIKQLIEKKDLKSAEIKMDEYLQNHKIDDLEDPEEWMEVALQIATKLDRKHKIAKYAAELMWLSDSKMEEYFEIWQDAIPTNQKAKYFERLITSAQNSEYYWGEVNKQLLYVFEKANMWERYVEHLEEAAFLGELLEFYPKVPQKYHPRIIKSYTAQIYLYLEQRKGREHYQYIAKRLQDLYDLGYVLQAKALNESLKELYPRHSALQDELGELDF
jgi:uncharacterized Zn finger protein